MTAATVDKPTEPPPPAEKPVLLRKPRRVGFRERIAPYSYIAPFFVIFLAFGAGPLIYTGWVSLHDWAPLETEHDFIGLDNYFSMVQDPRFWKAIGNTFSIFLLSAVPQVVMAIVLAAMLSANLRAKTFWRMGVLLPYVVAPVAVGLIFGKLFADESGLINAVLTNIGLDPVRWHVDILPSHFAIATMVNFRWTGYNTLIFLAAMQAIPRELYEAAIIDGAGRLRQFFSITIPQLRPTLIFIIITSTIGGLQIFDEPRMFNATGDGGSSRQWMTVTMYLYDLGWGPQKSFGRASAVALILFLVIVVIGMINFLITTRIATSGDVKVKKSKSLNSTNRRKR